MATQDDLYSARIFFNAVLPLFREIVERTSLQKAFVGKNGIIQISAMDGDTKHATHFVLTDGVLNTVLGESEDKPDLELAFHDLASFNGFFKGTSKKLPLMRGFYRIGLLVPTFRTLLKMADLLGRKDIPDDSATQELLTRLYFYLLSSGISQLNKAGHPVISHWIEKSPNRVYAWSVNGYDDVAAHLRIKAGKSKAARGRYTRSQPFFTMRFSDLSSALSILLGKGDMVDMITSERLILDGAPEFAAQIGDYMLLVGDYAQA